MTDSAALRFGVTSTIDRASRQWRRLAREVVEAHGVSEACALPLITIGRRGDGLRQGVLAEEVGVEGPSLVRVIDQLCLAGLVERRDDPSDRRARTLWLTDDGRAVTRRIETGLTTLRESVLTNLSPCDLEAALRVFKAIEEAASALSQRGSQTEAA